MKAKQILTTIGLLLVIAAVGQPQATNHALPRNHAKTVTSAVTACMDAMESAKLEVHSMMVVKGGSVVAEEWRNGARPDVAHELWSVSKTVTMAAVGFAVKEKRLKLTDRVVSFFPDKLPQNVSQNLSDMTVRDLLTMSCGHDTDPSMRIREKEDDWVKQFLAEPVSHRPGTYFCYNSVGTYMLSAIVQQLTGQRIVDYLYPRLFQPLGIALPQWQESPQGINTGGWGPFLKTEDMAKIGLLLLQQGKWNGKTLLKKKWVSMASSALVESRPAGSRPEQIKEWGMTKENSDWLQGYGFQLWQCRHNAYRADGAYGQYIIVLPERQAVIAVTAKLGNMQAELNLIWEHLLPVL